MRQRMIGILVVAVILLLGTRGIVRSDTLTITARQTPVRAGLDRTQVILTTVVSQEMTFALLETHQGRYKILLDGGREGWIVRAAGPVEQGARPLQVAPAPGQDMPRPSLYHQSWAVVVGVNRFGHPDIHTLNYAVNDAHAVAQALSSLGFPASNITLLLDAQATKQEVERLLSSVIRRATGPEDRLFIFFATHGATASLPGGGEEGYILLQDTDPTDLPFTALSMSMLRQIGQRIPARQILVAVDACYGGYSLVRAQAPPTLDQRYLELLRQSRVMQVLTAGRKNQPVLEEQGHGVFTRKLLDGLQGYADVNGDGIITGTELAAWMHPRVAQASDNKQDMQFGNLDGEGQFFFLLPQAGSSTTPTVAPISLTSPTVASQTATPGAFQGAQELFPTPLMVAYETLEQGDDQHAQALFQALAAQAKPEVKSQGFIGLAAVAWARGDAQQAGELAGQAEAIDPEVVYSHVLRGHLLVQQGKTAEATAAYRTATEKAHGLPWQRAVAYNRLGRLSAAQGETQQALALYDKALSQSTAGHQEKAVAYTNKGHMLATLGRYQEALGYYQHALQLNPDDRLTAALLHEAERREQLAQDQAQQERIEQLVAALLQMHREGKVPGSSDDDWTSRPFVMGFPPLQSQGTPSPRAGEDDVLLLRLGEALQAQHITIVERAVLDKILAELKLSASELVQREEAVRVGRILAARLMTIGSLTRNGAETRLSLRVVDTETTAIQAMMSATLQPPLEREGITDQFVALLVQKLRTAYPLQGRIVETINDEVVLNLGADHGVTPGLTLQVFGEDDPPSAGGKTTSTRRRHVGMIEVTRVEDARLSRAKVLQQTVAFVPGWKVREQ